MKRWALALAIALPMVGCLSAAEWPVATAAEIVAAGRVARPGDALVMADGEWRDAKVIFRGEGTATQPITLRARTPGGVTITGNSQLRMAGKHLVVDGLVFRECSGREDVVEFRDGSKLSSEDCRLTNSALIDCNPPNAKGDTRWVSLYGARNRVDHCYFTGKTNEGTTLVVWLGAGAAPEHRIDRNHFAHRPRLKVNGGETIRVGDSKTAHLVARVTVEENLFEQCNGEAEIISNKSGANVYRRNTFRECEGALTLRAGSGCLVEQNFFLGNGKPLTGGVRIIDADHRVWNNYFADLGGEGTRAAICFMNGIPDSPPQGYYAVKRAIVAFNTLVNCNESIVTGFVYRTKGLAEPTLPPEDCVLANNILHGGRAPLVKEVTPMLRAQWIGSVFSSAQPGVAVNAGLREVDARLTRGTDGMWRPSPQSPIRGKAEGEFAAITVDADGQPRGSTKSIGCDEPSAAPVTNRPLTAADVGPAWVRGSQSR